MDDQNLPKNIAKEIYKRSVELLKQKQRFEQLLAGVSEAVLAVDQDLKITIFNKAAERMFNVTATEVLGRHIDEVVHLEEISGEGISSKDFCFNYTSPQVVELNDLVIKAPNGQIARYITIKSSNIFSSDTAKECLITMTDMTREKMLENLKDEFISVTSHELRTPMTIIKNYLWMLSRGAKTEDGIQKRAVEDRKQKGESRGQLSDIQKNYVTKAQKGVERMLKLINDMLDVSRIDQNRVELHPTTVDLVKLLTDVVEDFKGKVEEKGLFLEMTDDREQKSETKGEVGSAKSLLTPQSSSLSSVLPPPTSPLLVRADEDKLREVVMNFLGNAVKFTEKGGITVEIKGNMGDKGNIGVAVTDTGKGIAEEDLEKLFHKFSRVNNSYTTAAEAGGTGLGLYITKSLVERMGGTVGVTSTEGQGSTFWFTLPIAS